MASIRKRGNRWQAQVRKNGSKPVTKSFLLKSDAQAWARTIETQIDRNELPVDRKALAQVTLGQLVERYKAEITPAKKSADNEASFLKAFLRHRMCSVSLADLSTAHFAEYRDERLKKVQARSVKRVLEIISNVLTVAETDWNYPLPVNPLRKLRIDVSDNRRERRLREGEQEALFASAAKARNPLMPKLVRFALQTGMRRSEMLNARVSHLDEPQGLLKIPRTKNGAPRTIPLTDEARAIAIGLAEGKKPSDRLFPIAPNAVRLSWSRITKRAGVEDLHFHDLRHEAISRFFELGLSIPEVAMISGHKDPRMLFRYTHPDPAKVRAKIAS